MRVRHPLFGVLVGVFGAVGLVLAPVSAGAQRPPLQLWSFTPNPDAPVFVASTTKFYPIVGGGTFGQPSTFYTYLTEWLSGIDVADVDNDGDLDMIGAGYDTVSHAQNIFFFRRNADGSFSRLIVMPFLFGTYSNDLRIADFNRDGLPDFVLGDYYGSGSQVFIQNPGGTFSLGRRLYSDSGGTGIAVGDVFGEGNVDVITSHLSGRVYLHTGDGAGDFYPPGDVISPLSDFGEAPGALVTLDADADGDLDIVVAVGPWQARTKAYLYLNNGNGGFATPTAPAFVCPIESMDAFDVDRDGREDIVLADYDGNFAFVRNVGGGFAAPTSLGLQFGRRVGAPPSYDTKVRDEVDGALLKWNSMTGAYFYCDGTTPIFGRGTVASSGCGRTLDLSDAWRRIHASADACAHTGSATVQLREGKAWVAHTLDDGNTLVGSCACP